MIGEGHDHEFCSHCVRPGCRIGRREEPKRQGLTPEHDVAAALGHVDVELERVRGPVRCRFVAHLELERVREHRTGVAGREREVDIPNLLRNRLVHGEFIALPGRVEDEALRGQPLALFRHLPLPIEPHAALSAGLVATHPGAERVAMSRRHGQYVAAREAAVAARDAETEATGLATFGPEMLRIPPERVRVGVASRGPEVVPTSLERRTREQVPLDNRHRRRRPAIRIGLELLDDQVVEPERAHEPGLEHDAEVFVGVRHGLPGERVPLPLSGRLDDGAGHQRRPRATDLADHDRHVADAAGAAEAERDAVVVAALEEEAAATAEEL